MGLFDDRFIEKLEYLHLVSRKLFAGTLKGDRRSTRKGTSVEFADYKDYAPGDDFRYIDWHIFRRLDRLLVKLFEEEEELHVYLLVDASRSMRFGEPPKFDLARRLAAALAYVALASGDRVSLAFFGERVTAQLPPVRGKGQIFNVFEFLERGEAAGRTDLAGSFAQFAHAVRRKGLVLVLSDLLDPAGFDTALRHLIYGKFDVFVLQLIDRADADPPLAGSLTLADSETGELREVQLTAAALEEYRAAFRAWCQEIEEFCRARGLVHVPAPTAAEFEALVLDVFREGRIVR